MPNILSTLIYLLLTIHLHKTYGLFLLLNLK
nr:MAG TPA: hypothetical protein [Caudoviricetes sp.]